MYLTVKFFFMTLTNRKLILGTTLSEKISHQFRQIQIFITYKSTFTLMPIPTCILFL